MSTHPTSLFVTALTAAIVTDDERYNLRGRNLTVHRREATERIRLDGANPIGRRSCVSSARIDGPDALVPGQALRADLADRHDPTTTPLWWVFVTA